MSSSVACGVAGADDYPTFSTFSDIPVGGADYVLESALAENEQGGGPVNHFRNKREAHLVSRSSIEGWNIFRHLWGTPVDRERRRGTWGGPQREAKAGRGQGGRDSGGRLTHASTAPVPSSGSIPRDSSSPGTITGSGKESDDATRTKLVDNGEPKRDLDPSLGRLRNRRPEDDAAKSERGSDSAERTVDDDGKPNKKAKTGLINWHLKPKEPFTVANQLQRTFLSSWINVLLLAAPVGIALNYVHSVDRIAIFVINFLAIIPLAAILGFATEEVALRTGETLGGLINATFGNAVELIVAIIALKDNQIAIVQTSLIGSILSNLLLVLGLCFFFGGLRRPEQYFNPVVAQTSASVLALAVSSVIVPSVFNVAASASITQADIAKLSRGTSVILLIVYTAYLIFQLHTHHEVFNEQSQKVPAKPWTNSVSIKQGLAMPSALMSHAMPDQGQNERLSKMIMNPGSLDEDDDQDDDPQLSLMVALGTLTISTVVIAFCAESMVGSIDSITKSGGLTQEFVGLILLPIVGNAAEHVTAVTVAIKDKMDLAIGVAVGSSMQVSLFLIPLLVIIGWGMDKQYMDLSFDSFQVAVLFVAVLLVNYLIGDGKSHWLEGFLLICLYGIIVVCSFWYPNTSLELANGNTTTHA
ncbi:Sodium/calcium exchanger membrane region [Metarhizium album ARSEF 1941]|uniref:Sodium/calcium exchanger membrane region n=1 Tax=Metarhizium album (strain ARSEF 1941) TaxID=1081103 RepID=A0A0B2WJS8_METAS|nr:Sodium/calcium exchanger membrane region [Metarhizium album ARSEF 1941]KHN94198.1 Sodium/calcium exchanger membrane region [Metarhizium album ARSEF 1941]